MIRGIKSFFGTVKGKVFVGLMSILTLLLPTGCHQYRLVKVDTQEFASNTRIQEQLSAYEFILHQGDKTYELNSVNALGSDWLEGNATEVAFEEVDLEELSKKDKKKYLKEHKNEVHLFLNEEAIVYPAQTLAVEETSTTVANKTVIRSAMIDDIQMVGYDVDKTFEGGVVGVLAVIGVIVVLLLVLAIVNASAEASDASNGSFYSGSGNSNGSNSTSDGSDSGSDSGSGS